jgi:Recombinase/Recombinase zinc beta ribbon domain
VVTLNDNRVYTERALDEDPTALLMSLLVFIRANEESAMKARRIRAAWDAKRAGAENKAMTSRGPAWLKLVNGHWEVIEDRAAVVRRIFEAAKQGVGQHTITELLNREKLPVFGRGNHWHRSYVVKILNNPAVIGTLIPHTLEYSSGKRTRQPQPPLEGYYPAIVDPAVYHAVAAMAETRAPLRGRHVVLRNALGGLARCPLCCSTMTLTNKGSGKKAGRPKLVCTKAKAGAGCKYHAVDYPRLEAGLLAQVDRLIGEVPAADPGLDARAEELQTVIFDKQDHLERLLDDLVSGALPNSPTVAARIRAAEAELDQLKEDLAAATRKAEASRGPLVARRLDELRAALTAKPLDRARVNTLLRQLCSGIVVDYPNWSLVFHWQHDGESNIVYGMPPVSKQELRDMYAC